MHDLLIAGGTVVTPGGSEPLDVAVDGERIAALAPHGELGREARRVIDATGCLVIPGGVDPHVHYAMDFEGILTTEGPEFSAAAAYGGNTTVVDFAFQAPPQTLHEAIADKQARLGGAMAVDYGLHTILTKEFSFDVVEEIGDVIRAGI